MNGHMRVLMAYNRSLLLAGLERQLSTAPGITMYHIDPGDPALLNRVRDFSPELVLLDQRDPDLDVSITVWRLLDQASQARILVLNAGDSCSALFERHSVKVTSLDQLVDVINAWRRESCANLTSAMKSDR